MAKVVKASGTLTSHARMGENPLGKAIEAAMIAATEKAMADGISDPDKIRELKLAARERVQAEHTPPAE